MHVFKRICYELHKRTMNCDLLNNEQKLCWRDGLTQLLF